MLSFGQWMWMAVVLVAGGCDLFDGRWQQHPGVSLDFRVEVTVSLSSEGVLFAGSVGSPIDKARAAIFLWRDEHSTQVYDAKGYIVALDRVDRRVWAVRGERSKTYDGSEYALVRSDDAGLHWKEVGPIPVRSASQLLVVSDKEAWVLGEGVLIRTVDAGATWVHIDAPGERNSVEEKLVNTGSAVMLVGPTTLVSKDGGAHWQALPKTGRRWLWDHGYFLVEKAKHEYELQVGSGAPRSASATISYVMVPDLLDVDGKHIRIAGSPVGSDIGTGLAMFESTDGGASFRRHRIPTTNSRGVALVHRGGAFALDSLSVWTLR